MVRAAETVAAIRAEREFQVGNVAALPEARGYAAMTIQASARQRDTGLHAAASTRLMQSVQQRGGVLSTEVAPPSLLSRAFSWEGGGRFVATATVLGLLGYTLTKK